jgi:hypothetical protein
VGRREQDGRGHFKNPGIAQERHGFPRAALAGERETESFLALTQMFICYTEAWENLGYGIGKEIDSSLNQEA